MIYPSKITKFLFFKIKLILSRESFNAVANWLTDVRTLASPNIVIILCGNKKDLDEQREVSFHEANQFAQENGKIFSLKLMEIYILK